jgi:flagellar biosynthesis/type III secretory pathway protein FliH
MPVIRKSAVVTGNRFLVPALQEAEQAFRISQTAEPSLESTPPLVPGSGTWLDAEKARLAQVASESEERAAQAFQTAKAEGYAAGLSEGRQEMADVTARLESLVEGMRRSEGVFFETMADRMTELVFEAIVKVVGEQSRSVAGVEGIVATAVAAARGSSAIRRIRLAPDDLSLIKTEAPELLDRWSDEEIEAVADARVQLGGCIVEGDRGNVDARLETQLERLREALLEARARMSPSA